MASHSPSHCNEIHEFILCTNRRTAVQKANPKQYYMNSLYRVVWSVGCILLMYRYNESVAEMFRGLVSRSADASNIHKAQTSARQSPRIPHRHQGHTIICTLFCHIEKYNSHFAFWMLTIYIRFAPATNRTT